LAFRKGSRLFAELGQQGLDLNRKSGASDWTFLNSRGQVVPSRSVSIALKLRCAGTFFNIRSGSVRENLNQVNSLPDVVED
jgi:hypothetical protein